VDQAHTWDIKPIVGALLVQDADTGPDDEAAWTVVSGRQPTEDEMRDLRFAWSAVRLIKSNAIVLVRNEAIAGVGSGQPNRLESVGIATRLAGVRAPGTVLASDAFFPFPDGIEAAAAAGVRAIIQPGGSMRDKRVIAAADAADMVMVFTGTRHFRH
jgi:phosphoribosylaminoimidazolecarboxamide formyltransferase/IMP cyclohydrolase